MKYGDKCWGKKKKGGEEGWERKKRKSIKEEKYAGAKGKGILNEGKGD